MGLMVVWEDVGASEVGKNVASGPYYKLMLATDEFNCRSGNWQNGDTDVNRGWAMMGENEGTVELVVK